MPYTDEFERLLKQREATYLQMVRQMGESLRLRETMPHAPDPLRTVDAFNVAGVLGQIDPQEQATRQVQREPLRAVREHNQLIGAARTYGIQSPERIPANELEEMIAERRQQWAEGDVESSLKHRAMQSLLQGDHPATAAAQLMRWTNLLGSGVGRETLRIFGNLAERVPWVGDIVSRGKFLQDADRFYGELFEGLTADMTPRGRELSQGAATAVGIMPAGYALWAGLGSVGALSNAAIMGGRVMPAGRAAVRGLLTEMAIQDPTAPLQEQALTALFGAGMGASAVSMHTMLGRMGVGAGVGAIAGAVAGEGDLETMGWGAGIGAATFGLAPLLGSKLRRAYPTRSLARRADDGFDDTVWWEHIYDDGPFPPRGRFDFGFNGPLDPTREVQQALPPGPRGLPPAGEQRLLPAPLTQPEASAGLKLRPVGPQETQLGAQLGIPANQVQAVAPGVIRVTPATIEYVRAVSPLTRTKVPEVVYHGTRNPYRDIDPARFMPGLYTPGYYATTEITYANNFADDFGLRINQIEEVENQIRSTQNQIALEEQRGNTNLVETYAAAIEDLTDQLTYLREVQQGNLQGQNLRPHRNLMERPHNLDEYLGVEGAERMVVALNAERIKAGYPELDVPAVLDELMERSYWNSSLRQATRERVDEVQGHTLMAVLGGHDPTGSQTLLAKAYQRAGYDGLVVPLGDDMITIVWDPAQVYSAFGPLDQAQIVGMTPHQARAAGSTNLTPYEASYEAAQLTKREAVAESPALAQQVRAAQLDDADVAWAIVESFPGEVGVVQNVGDVAGTIRRIMQEQMPNGIGPQDFRVVKRTQFTDPELRARTASADPTDIVTAAVRTPEGEYFVGGHHWDAFDAAIAAGKLPEPEVPFEELVRLYGGEKAYELAQGYINARGQYIDRYRAAEMRSQYDPWFEEVGPGAGLHATDIGFPRGPGTKMDIETVTDILVSSGRPISNKMVKEYETYGVFSGQRVRAPGVDDGVIVSLDANGAVVKPAFGGPQVRVPHENLLPMKSSAIVDDLPQLYDDFAAYGQGRIVQQAVESGIAPFSLFTPEGATQIPTLMEEFISAMGVDPKGYYGATLRNVLEHRHVDALKNLAPDDLGYLRQVQAEAAALSAQHGGGLEVASTAELAALRNLEWRPDERVVVDLASDTRHLVDSEEAARAFIRDFQREAFDNSPVGPFPIEALETTPGVSVHGGRSQGNYRSTDDYINAADAAEANWFAMGGEEMLQRMLGGGAGGGEPPRPPPPGGGAAGAPDDPLRLNPGVRGQAESAWKRARRDQLDAVSQAADRLNSMVTKLFVPMRNLAIAIDREFRQFAGISYERLVVALQDGHTKMINDARPWESKAFEALRPVRTQFLRDGTFWEVMNAPAEFRPHLMQNAGLNAAERRAVDALDQVFAEFLPIARQRYPNMGELDSYITHMRRYEEGLPGDPFRKPKTQEWGPAHERGDEAASALEKDMSKIINRYFRSFYKVQHMNDHYQTLKQAIAPDEVPAVLKRALGDWADQRMWGLDPSDDLLLNGTRSMLNVAGKPFGISFSVAQLADLFHSYIMASYGAGLGLSFAQVIRDLPQALIGFAHIGFDVAMPTMNRMVRDKAFRQRAYDLAYDAGAAQKGHGMAIDPDIFGGTGFRGSAVGEAFDPRRLDEAIKGVRDQLRKNPGDPQLRARLESLNNARAQEALSRVGDKITDAMRKVGIKGSLVEGMTNVAMKGYAVQSDLSRITNFIAAHDHALAAINKYKAGLAQGQRTLPDLEAQLLRDSRVSRFQGTIQDNFLDMVRERNFDGAAKYFGRHLSDTQTRFGMTEHPEFWRNLGPVTGRVGMKFTSFNSQMLANFTQIIRDPRISFADKSAYFAQIGSLQALWGVGQLTTGWNLMRMSIAGIGFSYAGSSIWGSLNAIQTAAAQIQSHDPTRRHGLSPVQEALVAAGTAAYGSSPFTVDPRRATWNPWAGGLRTAQGFHEASTWGLEGLANFMVTGERDDPQLRRHQRGLQSSLGIADVEHLLREGPPLPGGGAQ